MKRTIETVRASAVNWTIVRVPMLANDQPKGEVQYGYVGRGMNARISRADMTSAMLEKRRVHARSTRHQQLGRDMSIEQVVPAVHRIGLGVVNAYLPEDEGEQTRIDTGTPGSPEALLEAIHSLEKQTSHWHGYSIANPLKLHLVKEIQLLLN